MFQSLWSESLCPGYYLENWEPVTFPFPEFRNTLEIIKISLPLLYAQDADIFLWAVNLIWLPSAHQLGRGDTENGEQPVGPLCSSQQHWCSLSARSASFPHSSFISMLLFNSPQALIFNSRSWQRQSSSIFFLFLSQPFVRSVLKQNISEVQKFWFFLHPVVYQAQAFENLPWYRQIPWQLSEITAP